ncbi:uncharacterized protein METZ01_LOCUS395457 [marine metagenome]|uniref:Uncharacterized protein n=1 Tax=marine metagenome TaxID=408172 RepID=A0A382V7X9_9ZZZZ
MSQSFLSYVVKGFVDTDEIGTLAKGQSDAFIGLKDRQSIERFIHLHSSNK